MESLSDKLKSLGVHLGIGDLSPQPPTRKATAIEDVLEGFEDETPLGSTFLVQNDYPPEHYHGIAPLYANYDLEVMAQWAKVPHLPGIDPQKLVFLDTETSGLAGGSGTFVFLIGLGYQTEQGFRVTQFFLRDPGQEPALLASLARYIDPFEAVVTYNGKTFDIPVLNARHVINRMPSPFSEMAHIDLLPLARRLWRKRLPSRALSSLEYDILEFERGQEEIPGWMVPQIYLDYLHTREATPLAGVFYHNAMDILSLAALFNTVDGMLAEPKEARVQYGLDLVSIAQLHEDLGRLDRAIELYELGLQKDIPRPFFLQTLKRYALLYRRQGKWPEALNLWYKAAEYHQVDACIEIAKYYEHRQRDIAEALRWANTALDDLQQQTELPPGLYRLFSEDLYRRLERLGRKLGTDQHG